MKVVINKCFGGFGLSQAAYEKLIEWGVPVQPYYRQPQDPETGLYKNESRNDGRVIFDREATPRGESDQHDRMYWQMKDKYGDDGMLTGRYWDCWTDHARDDPLIVRLVEELGDKANGQCSRLAIVEIPDGTDYEISEYDGQEHIAEKHRTWA